MQHEIMALERSISAIPSKSNGYKFIHSRRLRMNLNIGPWNKWHQHPETSPVPSRANWVKPSERMLDVSTQHQQSYQKENENWLLLSNRNQDDPIQIQIVREFETDIDCTKWSVFIECNIRGGGSGGDGSDSGCGCGSGCGSGCSSDGSAV